MAKRIKKWNIIVDGKKKYMTKEEVLLRSMIPRKRKRRKYKYAITYFDPKTPTGTDKTWKFRTQKAALKKRRSLAFVWGNKPSKIRIYRL